jgi:hypothetical protein
VVRFGRVFPTSTSSGSSTSTTSTSTSNTSTSTNPVTALASVIQQESPNHKRRVGPGYYHVRSLSDSQLHSCGCTSFTTVVAGTNDYTQPPPPPAKTTTPVLLLCPKPIFSLSRSKSSDSHHTAATCCCRLQLPSALVCRRTPCRGTCTRSSPENNKNKNKLLVAT